MALKTERTLDDIWSQIRFGKKHNTKDKLRAYVLQQFVKVNEEIVQERDELRAELLEEQKNCARLRAENRQLMGNLAVLKSRTHKE